MKTKKQKAKQRYTIKKRGSENKKIQSGGRYRPPRVVPLPPTPETDVILDRYNRLVILYNRLSDEYDDLEAENHDLEAENHDLENKNKVLVAEKPEYVSAFEQTKERYNKLVVAYEGLIRDLDAEVDAGVELRRFNINLKKNNAALKAMYDELQRSCAELQIKYDKLLGANKEGK